MARTKLKAEKREEKKKKREKVAKTSGTLAGQHLKMKTSKKYKGDVKKMK